MSNNTESLLNEISLILANYCCLSNGDVRKLLDFYKVMLVRADQVDRSLILRGLNMKDSVLLEKLFSCFHAINNSKVAKKDEITWDDFFQSVIFFSCVPLKYVIKLCIMLNGIPNENYIDLELFLEILNLIHKPNAAEDCDMYFKTDSLYVNSDEFYSIVAKNNLYYELQNMLEAMRYNILGHTRYENIIFRINNFDTIKSYQLAHNGAYPPVGSCFENFKIKYFGRESPYAYDFSGNSIYDVEKILKVAKCSMLALTIKESNNNALDKKSSKRLKSLNPALMKIKCEEGSVTLTRPPNDSIRKSNLRLSVTDNEELEINRSRVSSRAKSTLDEFGMSNSNLFSPLTSPNKRYIEVKPKPNHSPTVSSNTY